MVAILRPPSASLATDSELAAEQEAREDADTALTQAIADEATARANADTALSTSVAGKVSKADNLSDLVDVEEARGNLGLGDAATQDAADLPVSTAQGVALVRAVGTRAGLAQGAICFTWDDGDPTWQTVSQAAVERNQAHSFFIYSNAINAPTGISAAEIQALVAAGHEVGAHSVDHAKMTLLTAEQRVLQYENSRTALEAIMGAGTIRTWSYPFGTASSPAGRDLTTDRELYLRYDRLVDTGTGGDCLYSRHNRPPFVIRRLDWGLNDSVKHARVMNFIRSAVSRPIIVNLYAHTLASPLEESRMLEALDLAAELGIPCIRIKDAFPSHPQMFVDCGFEDAALDSWGKVTAAAASIQSVVLATDTGLPGSRVLQLSSSSTTTTGNSNTEQVWPVQPGISYTISYRGKLNAPVDGAVARSASYIRWFDLTKTAIGGLTYGPSLVAADTTWGRRTHVITSPADSAFMAVGFAHEQRQGDFHVDHLHVGPTLDGSYG